MFKDYYLQNEQKHKIYIKYIFIYKMKIIRKKKDKKIK